MSPDRTLPPNDDHRAPEADADRTDADDRALRHAIQALPQAADPARLEALNRRVLAQWHDARGMSPRVAAHGAAGGLRGWLVLHGGGRRRWLAGVTGLAVGLALLVGTWLRSPDPALDELMQPDVLSQMAAGEM